MESASQARSALHRVLFFAHTPPPFHGQSWMVQLMLDGLRGKGWRIEPHDTPNRQVDGIHLDCKYSQGLDDLGKRPFLKLFIALRYIAWAVVCKYRHHLDTLYFIPAPAKRVAIYRDWLVLGICRLFYKRTVFHWHAIGLGWWVEKEATFIERWISRVIYRNAISLSVWYPNVQDAAYLSPARNLVLPNAIPDPCPDYESSIALTRTERERESKNARQRVVTVLFLSRCTKKKGLFDAVNAVCKARECLKHEGTIDLRLLVSGMFVEQEEYEAFRALALRVNGENKNIGEGGCPSFSGSVVSYNGLVPHQEIGKHYSLADVYIFPSYLYPEHHESFGLVLLEAAFHGLPCITTQPLVGGQGLALPAHKRLGVRDVEGMANALCELARNPCNFNIIRKEALEKFAMGAFVQRAEEFIFEDK